MVDVSVITPTGSTQQKPLDQLTFADLSALESVTDLPATFAILLAVGAPNGMRRPILAPSYLLRSSDAPKLPQGTSLDGTEVIGIRKNGVLYQVTVDEFQTRKKQLTQIGTATVTISAGIALAAGVQTKSITLNGIVAGEPVFVAATAIPPAGWWPHATAIATAANTLTVAVNNPALAIGASGSIPIAVFAMR